MHIEKLSLFGFKNYEEVSLTFSEKVNCLVGENGSGKTNLLDAIHYLSITKSAFNSIDNQNIRFGSNFFSIRGDLIKEGKNFKLLCSFQEGSGKSFKLNQEEYTKLSEHVGKFPVVLIVPNDMDIIRDGSEVRRKLFDTVICQLNGGYLHDLVNYNRYLRQRNSALKAFALSGKVDYDLLRVYDERLLELGARIYFVRHDFMGSFAELFTQHYEQLSDHKENVGITYISECAQDDFENSFRQNLKKDIALERTTMGTHKDDYKFTIEGKPLKKFGSQGQQKTFIVALKMAHFEIIKRTRGFKPILLLDDIFDKLDSKRIEHLMKMVIDETFGQIFITDAREERTRSILKELNIAANFYYISKGTVR